MRVRRDENAPMLVAPADVVHDQARAVMEQQNAAEHVGLAPVAHEFRPTALIADGNSEVVIVETAIVRDAGLRTGKDEDAGLSVSAHFVLDECRTAFRAVEHDTGQNPVDRPALSNDARGIEHIHRGVLIAADIAESDT